MQNLVVFISLLFGLGGRAFAWCDPARMMLWDFPKPAPTAKDSPGPPYIGDLPADILNIFVQKSQDRASVQSLLEVSKRFRELAINQTKITTAILHLQTLKEQI